MKTKFVYVGIRVTDMAKSIDFYTKVLGMKMVGKSRIEATKGDVVTLAYDEQEFSLELNHYDNDSPFNTRYLVGEGLDHLAFGVKDLDQAVADAKRAGYPVVQQLKTASSRWLYVQDPDGIWIELFDRVDFWGSQ
ncbi:MAG: VOC family protein [Thaumarchaeota archaeon]|nr:VOC family protein [Nitrososphaerota archaeon]